MLKECSKFDKDIMDYIEECEKVNTYYIESKYPMDSPTDYPKQEMEKSIEMTEFLIKYIKKKLNE